MSDFDDQLRAAMAAADGPPPVGLIDGIRRRHRRHARRTGLASVAIVAAIVAGIPPVAHVLWSGPGQSSGGSGAAALPSRPGTSTPTAAAGTVLAGCDGANVGQVASGGLSRDWRNGAVEAGPVWFVNVGGHSKLNGRLTGGGNGKPTLYVTAVVITGVPANSRIVVRVGQADRKYLRFLYGPADSLNAGIEYTMASGESGVTFLMCPLDGGPASAEPITDYYGGLLLDGTHCVPVEVWTPGRARPITINLGACS